MDGLQVPGSSLLTLNEAPVWIAQPLYQLKLHPCVLRAWPSRPERQETRRSPVNNVAAVLSPVLRPQPDSPVPFASVPLETQMVFPRSVSSKPLDKALDTSRCIPSPAVCEGPALDFRMECGETLGTPELGRCLRSNLPKPDRPHEIKIYPT